MAYTVTAAFEQFFDTINLSGDHRDLANTRRDDVIATLKDKLAVNEAFATGSIPRFTALRGTADVDVIVALHYGKHIKDKNPSQVLQLVRDSLADYRTNVRKNGQAVTLYYKTWPNVDIVPAAQIADSSGNVSKYEIPDAIRERWLRSDPKGHGAAVDARSSICGATFRKLIKALKHWNETHGGFLQSYHVEVLALQTFSGQLSDVTWDAFQFFDKLANTVNVSLWHHGDQVDAYLSLSDRTELQSRAGRARDEARAAWHATYSANNDHQAAITSWRRVFGDAFPAYG
jgi:hypothetical protein